MSFLYIISTIALWYLGLRLSAPTKFEQELLVLSLLSQSKKPLLPWEIIARSGGWLTGKAIDNIIARLEEGDLVRSKRGVWELRAPLSGAPVYELTTSGWRAIRAFQGKGYRGTLSPPPTKMFVVWPGYIHSKADGDRHFVTAERLIRLYNVPLRDCIVVHWGQEGRCLAGLHQEQYIHLGPRYDGDYTLPATRGLP